MKTYKVLLTAVMFLAATASVQAQSFYPVLKSYTPEKLERVDRAYAISLGHENEDVVESALAVVTMMKLDVPDDRFSEIREKIEDLTVDGATPVIRYKAYIADAVFSNPGMFQVEASRRYDDEGALFSALADRMTKTLLSAK